MTTDSTISESVGNRLRSARKVKTMTLRDLALQIGCSESLLSKSKTAKAIRR